MINQARTANSAGDQGSAIYYAEQALVYRDDAEVRNWVANLRLSRSFNLAQDAWRRGDFALASTFFQQAMQDPSRLRSFCSQCEGEYYMFLGDQAQSAGNAAQAVEHYRRAQRLNATLSSQDQQMVRELEVRATVLQDGDRQRAAERTRLEAQRPRAEAHNRRGEQMLAAGNVDGAVAEFAAAHRAAPNDPAIDTNWRRASAEQAYAEGDIETGVNLLRQVARANPNDAGVASRLGEMEQRRNELTAAVRQGGSDTRQRLSLGNNPSAGTAPGSGLDFSSNRDEITREARGASAHGQRAATTNQEGPAFRASRGTGSPSSTTSITSDEYASDGAQDVFDRAPSETSAPVIVGGSSQGR